MGCCGRGRRNGLRSAGLWQRQQTGVAGRVPGESRTQVTAAAPPPAQHRNPRWESQPVFPVLGRQSGLVFGPAVQPGREGGREDLWAPNLHQCGSGMSNREVGLLPPSAPGNALGKVGGATLCHLADVLVRIFGDGGGSSCVALW